MFCAVIAWLWKDVLCRPLCCCKAYATTAEGGFGGDCLDTFHCLLHVPIQLFEPCWQACCGGDDDDDDDYYYDYGLPLAVLQACNVNLSGAVGHSWRCDSAKRLQALSLDHQAMHECGCTCASA